MAGTARGRTLVPPPGRDVRPTGDRVREATFAALGSLGAVDGAAVLDLFAGSGALGVEALSRGAASATFVDNDRAATEVIRQNVDSADVADRATVVRSSAERFCADHTDTSYDLAFLDPPYDFDNWARLLAIVPARTVVIESDRNVDAGDGYAMLRQKRYGGTVVAIARRPD